MCVHIDNFLETIQNPMLWIGEVEPFKFRAFIERCMLIAVIAMLIFDIVCVLNGTFFSLHCSKIFIYSFVVYRYDLLDLGGVVYIIEHFVFFFNSVSLF